MNKILLFLLITVILSKNVCAQQNPHYTQYMYNMNVVNPAYAGSKETIAIAALYRKQWVNIEDAPNTITLSAHAPVGSNVGLGISCFSDEIGPVSEQNVFADLSYTLKFSQGHRLAFGLKLGAAFHKVGLRDIQSSLPDPSEGIFGKDISDVNFNIGAGIFYYSDKYYLAISVPNTLNAAHLDYDGRAYGSDVSHFFATAGYVFDFSSSIKFKPSVLVKSALGVSPSFDLSANFLFNEKLEIGGTYRLEDSYGGLVNFEIKKGLRIGYAYDHIISNLNVTTPSSHEFIILYDIFLPKKVSRSPRFF